MIKNIYVKNNQGTYEKWEVYGETKDTYKIEKGAFITEVYKKACFWVLEFNNSLKSLYSSEIRNNYKSEYKYNFKQYEAITDEHIRINCTCCGKLVKFDYIGFDQFIDVNTYLCDRCIDRYKWGIDEFYDIDEI